MTNTATYDSIRSQVRQQLWASEISNCLHMVNDFIGGLPDDSQRKIVDHVEVSFNTTKWQILINLRGKIKEAIK